MQIVQNEKSKIAELWQELFSLNYKQNMLNDLSSRLWLFKKELNLNELEIEFIVKIYCYKGRSCEDVKSEQGVDMLKDYKEQEESLKQKKYLVIREEFATRDGVEGVRIFYDFKTLLNRLNKLAKEYFEKLSIRVYELQKEIEKIEKEKLEKADDYESTSTN